jgi:hypothetical protein
MSKSLASQRANATADQSARPGTLILLTRRATGHRQSQKSRNRNCS